MLGAGSLSAGVPQPLTVAARIHCSSVPHRSCVGCPTLLLRCPLLVFCPGVAREGSLSETDDHEPATNEKWSSSFWFSLSETGIMNDLGGLRAVMSVDLESLVPRSGLVRVHNLRHTGTGEGD